MAPLKIMSNPVFEILVCPLCKGKLRSYQSQEKFEVVCKLDRLAFAVRDDIPIMLVDHARKLSLEETEAIK